MYNRRKAMIAKLFNVNYKVEHWIQNIFDDEYTRLSDFEMLCSAVAGTHVGTSYNGQSYIKDRIGFKALNFNTETPISADGSTVLKIYYDRLYYMMNFDLGDNGYGVNPIYARYETPIPQNLIPSRTGYTFTGWTPAVPATMPAENNTYTACWEAGGNANINLLFWYENANDSGYTYVGSATSAVEYFESKTVKPSDFQNVSFAGRDNYHFIFNSAKNDEVALNANGSTIVNIYFTRKTYQLVFFNCRQAGHTTDEDSCYPATGAEALNIANNTTGFSVRDDGHLYKVIYGTGSQSWNVDKYAFKWQQDVSSYWANGIAQREPGRRWRPYFDNCISESTGKQVYNAGVGMMTIMPDTNVVFRFLSNGQYECTMNFWVEPKLGEPSTKTYNNRNYTQKYKFVCKFGDITETEEYVDIEGFTKVYPWTTLVNEGQISTNTSNKTKTAHFYYIRNIYPLTYISNSKTVNIVDVKFEDKIDGTINNGNFVPPYPSEWEPDAYEFKGWYLDPNCSAGTEVNWNSHTMPVGGVSVYAKWEHKIHTVTTVGDGIVSQRFIVQHGKMVVDDAPENPTRDGYSFISWFYIDENGNEVAFTFDMPIIKSLTVYPKWKEDIVTNSTELIINDIGDELLVEDISK